LKEPFLLKSPNEFKKQKGSDPLYLVSPLTKEALLKSGVVKSKESKLDSSYFW
jgi:hypothetical protein